MFMVHKFNIAQMLNTIYQHRCLVILICNVIHEIGMIPNSYSQTRNPFSTDKI